MRKAKNIYIRPSIEAINLDRSACVCLGSKKDNDHTHPTIPDQEILSTGGANKSKVSGDKVFPDRPF